MAALAAASPGGDEGLEEDEDELEPGLDEAEAEPEVAKAAGAARGAVLTRRGITLRVLLRDGLLEPGRGVLSIYYLGKKFVGDLGSDGTITWQETGQVFNSPSAWATHCKRLVNPAKKSGCGWASVRYKGQKLDQYKAAWLRKHQPNVPPPEESLASEGEEEELPEDEEEEAAREGRLAVPEPAAPKKPEERSKKQQQGKGLAEAAGTDGGSAGKRLEVKPRVPVRYCTLGTRDSARNPQTLVEVTSFAAINKFQPFNVAISSNVLLLLDFHSHLTRSEVVGYLGGRWDTNTQLLTVLRAFPCRTRLGDAEAAGAVEEEICQSLFLRGLSLVGWYHSHPFGPALPSLHDIDAQMDYQLKLQGSGNGFQPCLGLICGPFYHGNPGVESKIAPFWVMPPPEQRPNDYGIPMDVEVTYIQDGFLTNDVVQEMVREGWGSPKTPRAHWGPTTCPHSPGDGGSPISSPHRGLGAAGLGWPCLALGHPQACSPSVPSPDAAGGVLQGSPRPGEVPGAVESGSDLPGQAEGGKGWRGRGALLGHPLPVLESSGVPPSGLPGLPHPQRPELQPRPGADLQPAEAQRVRARGPSVGPGASRSPGGARSPGALPGPAGAAPGAPRSPPSPGGGRAGAGSVARWFVEVVV
uniref:MPN domain-containing protein n=1 Tax=Junco hyemalis TaxID=40217 RepID=A0A8C5NMC0_JUNHY